MEVLGDVVYGDRMEQTSEQGHSQEKKYFRMRVKIQLEHKDRIELSSVMKQMSALPSLLHKHS